FFRGHTTTSTRGETPMGINPLDPRSTAGKPDRDLRRGHGTRALGPSDSPDTGADLAGNSAGRDARDADPDSDSDRQGPGERDARPFDRYFPDLHDALLERLPNHCVIDGEIVIATPAGLDFDALQMRLHPAASRVAKLAQQAPASFVAFDALAVAGRDVRAEPQPARRARPAKLLAGAGPPVYPPAATG